MLGLDLCINDCCKCDCTSHCITYSFQVLGQHYNCLLMVFTHCIQSLGHLLFQFKFFFSANCSICTLPDTLFFILLCFWVDKLSSSACRYLCVMESSELDSLLQHWLLLMLEGSVCSWVSPSSQSSCSLLSTYWLTSTCWLSSTCWLTSTCWLSSIHLLTHIHLLIHFCFYAHFNLFSCWAPPQTFSQSS